MARYQFNLRQLLIAVVVVAVLLVLVRPAVRSHGVAVGLVVMAIGAALLALLHVLTYGFLRAFGAVLSTESHETEDVPKTPIEADARIPAP